MRRKVLDWHRTRWQVDLVFQRFKSLAQLGHLPKHDDESAKAWLFGKLFVAFLAEKLVSHARAIFPWGLRLGKDSVLPVPSMTFSSCRTSSREQSHHPCRGPRRSAIGTRFPNNSPALLENSGRNWHRASTSRQAT